MKCSTMLLATLYKKTATGAVQSWAVQVESDLRGFNPVGVITTTYGQVDGVKQTTSDTVREGKNLGKTNATSAFEQAKLQARQQWDKKIKQGYTTDLKKASTTDNVLDAIKPMLAHVYEDHPKKVTWPALVQPKLDGMRCIAIVKDGTCKLYSRTQKPIETMPHIVEAVEKLAGGEDLILDGELYAHALSSDFNKIMSIIKRNEIHPEHELVEYHVYDVPSSEGTTTERMDWLEGFFVCNQSRSLQRVKTLVASSEEEMQEILGWFIADGYEGLMYRRMDAAYEGKRSHGLLKVKTFRDEEFEVTSVEEGNGKLQGKAGALWCLTKEGKAFKAKMQGTLDSLTDYLVNFNEKYRGRKLTVKFQNLTPDGVPRFPVGIRFREEE